MNSKQFSVNSERITEYGTRNTTIGLVTCQKYMEMTPDEQALKLVLADVDIEAVPVAWDDVSVDWAAFDGLLIRTIWNYHEAPDVFRAWLDGIEQAGVPMWNSVETIRWNMEKTYLRDLAQKGLSVVPTVWLDKGEAPILTDLLHKQGWAEAVVKPAISASAIETWVASTTSTSSVTATTGSANTDSDQVRFDEICARKAMMVQQKMPIEQGEWSLLFFGGEYSHCVLKRPKDGDFRVQEEYGGTSTLTAAPDYLIEQAQQILKAVPDTLYARVDGLDVNGRFVLMELELIEPYLFLIFKDGAVEKFAEKLMQKINENLGIK